MPDISLAAISKVYPGGVRAVDRIDLTIRDGEFLILLGPSGCGKSTTLRMIAGLEDITEGDLLLDGRRINDVDPKDRELAFVFQNYALFPHMSVAANLTFGMRLRKVPAAEIESRLRDVVALLGLGELLDRKPKELSGGQRQRVALGRALLRDPVAYLLDEPLSNLDAKLRHEMRGEIRRICKESGFTTIYVTHDQKEALSIADRIALLKDGRLVQIGTPAELYHRPRTSFVADFIGNTNLLKGRVTDRVGATTRLETPVGTMLAAGKAESGAEVWVSIRPEQMRIVNNGVPPGPNRLVGKTLETTFLGEASEHVFLVNQQRLRVVSVPPLFDVPDQLVVELDPQDVVILPE